MAACLCPIVDGLIDTGDGIVLSVCVEYREILHHGNDVRLLCGSDLVTCFRFASICLSRGRFSAALVSCSMDLPCYCCLRAWGGVWAGKLLAGCALVSGFALSNPIAIYTTAGQTRRDADADAGMESLVLWRVQPARCSFLPSKLIGSQR